MSAREFTEKLAKTVDEIGRLTSELDHVKASKMEALSQGKSTDEVEALNVQLRIRVAE
jgi:hypothetical protein